MNKAELFDKALAYHGLSKKAFAEKGGVPYDTVAGWKKRGDVPEYAVILLKKLAMEKHRGYHVRTKRAVKRKGVKALDPRLAKRIEAAFWGKNAGSDTIVRMVKRGDPAYVKPFFENLYYKDALAVLGQKQIEKLLPLLDEQFDTKTAAFWHRVANAEIGAK
jgi:transposase